MIFAAEQPNYLLSCPTLNVTGARGRIPQVLTLSERPTPIACNSTEGWGLGFRDITPL